MPEKETIFIVIDTGGSLRWQEEQAERIKLHGFEYLDLFIHAPYGLIGPGWRVTEGRTGQVIGKPCYSKKEARQSALATLQPLSREAIEAKIRKCLTSGPGRGLSPKYQEPKDA